MKRTVLLFFLFTCIVCFPVVFQDKTWFFADNFSLFVPLRIFFSDSIRKGDFPWWNPYIFSGTPFWADISNAMLYPVTWLFVFLSPATALNVSILFHIILGAVGIATLSRALSIPVVGQRISGVIWILSLTVQGFAHNLVAMQSLSWVPWIIAAALQVRLYESFRSWILFSLAVTIGLLAGHPYPIFYAVFASIIMIFASRKFMFTRIAQLCISGVIISLLCAPVLFPFLELVSHSTRIQISAEEAAVGSLNPSHLLSFFLPNIWSNVSQGISWGPDWGKQRGIVPYVTIVGIISIILYGLKKKSQISQEKKILWWIGVASFIFSLGVGSFFIRMLWFFPFLHSIRSPEMAIILWLVTGSVLFYPAIQEFQKITQLISRKLLIVLSVITTVLLLLKETSYQWFPMLWTNIDAFLNRRLSNGFHTLPIDLVLIQHVLKQCVVALALSISMLLILKKKHISWLLVCGVLVLDLFIAVHPSLLFAPSSIYTTPQKILSIVQDDQYRTLSLNGQIGWTGLPTYWDNMVMREPFAQTRYSPEEKATLKELKARKASLVPNWNMPPTISSPFGYSTMILQSAAAYWEDVENGTSINDLDRPDLADVRYQEQSVRYVVGDKILFQKEYIEKLSSNLRYLGETEESLVYELEHSKSIVRSADGVSPEIIQNSSVMRFHAKEADAVEYEVAMQWYPGWSCMVDTGWCSVERGKSGMIVRRSGGNQAIELRFVPRYIHLYLWMSWIGIVLVVFLLRRRTPLFGLSAVHI